MRKKEEGMNGEQLCSYWHTMMELQEDRISRGRFFEEVVAEANQLSMTYASFVEIHAVFIAENKQYRCEPSQSRGYRGNEN